MFANILFMKIDVTKLFVLLWASSMGVLIYFIFCDVHYLTKLMHAYISMAMEIVKH